MSIANTTVTGLTDGLQKGEQNDIVLFMRRAVIVGGFAESNRVLDRVAEAIYENGQADDADVFNFRHAYDHPELLEKALAGADGYTHSAGIIAVRNSLATPARLVACNGPEQRSVPRLLLASQVKTFHHLTDRDDARAHGSALVGNGGELVFHAYGNVKHLSEISRFSTSSAMIDAANNGIESGVGIGTRDEFFPEFTYDQAGLALAGVRVEFIDGRHDELLMHPEQALQAFD